MACENTVSNNKQVLISHSGKYNFTHLLAIKYIYRFPVQSQMIQKDKVFPLSNLLVCTAQHDNNRALMSVVRIEPMSSANQLQNHFGRRPADQFDSAFPSQSHSIGGGPQFVTQSVRYARNHQPVVSDIFADFLFGNRDLAENCLFGSDYIFVVSGSANSTIVQNTLELWTFLFRLKQRANNTFVEIFHSR